MVVDLPGEVQHLPGHLRYDPVEGMELEILDGNRDIGDTFSAARSDLAFIQGQLLNGSLFTLVDCIRGGTTSGVAGVSKIRIIGNQLLVGIHLRDEAETPFEELRVTMTGLNEWFGADPLKWDFKALEPPAVGRRVSMVCEHLPRIGFTPCSGGAALLSDQNISFSRDAVGSGTIRSAFSLRVRPSRPFGLRGCNEELFRLQAFISLLCGRPSFYQDVLLSPTPEPGTAVVPVHYLARFARPPDIEKPRPWEILLPLPLIRDVLPDIWSTWTQRYQLYQSAVELYTSTDLFHGQLLSFQMLAITQALETLHRNRFAGSFVPASDYGLVYEAMVAAIPTAVAADLRQALKKRLEYGNEFSLRRRLNELARRLPPGIAEHIHPELRRFLEQCVHTRNYLTHFDASLKDTAFRGIDLYWATRLLRWFFLAVLLNDLGVPDPALVSVFRANEDLRHARNSLVGEPTDGGIQIVRSADTRRDEEREKT